MQTIFVDQDRETFTVVNNRLLRNEKLSWEARGLLCYILSLPTNWQINVSDLINRSNAGRDKIYRILSELKELKYVEYKSINGKKCYYVYETPR